MLDLVYGFPRRRLLGNLVNRNTPPFGNVDRAESIAFYLRVKRTRLFGIGRAWLILRVTLQLWKLGS